MEPVGTPAWGLKHTSQVDSNPHESRPSESGTIMGDPAV